MSSTSLSSTTHHLSIHEPWKYINREKRWKGKNTPRNHGFLRDGKTGENPGMPLCTASNTVPHPPKKQNHTWESLDGPTARTEKKKDKERRDTPELSNTTA
jgi:hypothetical protein